MTLHLNTSMAVFVPVYEYGPEQTNPETGEIAEQLNNL